MMAKKAHRLQPPTINLPFMLRVRPTNRCCFRELPLRSDGGLARFGSILRTPFNDFSDQTRSLATAFDSVGK